MDWSNTILILGFAGFFAQNVDLSPTPVSKPLEEFAHKARREGQAGAQIPAPEDLFSKVTSTMSVYPTICDSVHRAALQVSRLPYETRGAEVLAVQGQGYCYCSWAGNCRFWIYRKHKGKYEKLLEAENVQGFAFLPTRDKLPYLILWTRNSAVKFTACALEFNGTEYRDAYGWVEEYKYEDEDGEFSVHEIPGIMSKSFPEDPPLQ
jgi:hypothetical protein